MDIYQLRGAHIGPQTILEISQDRHVALANARHCLIDAGSFERRYELLMGNFLAFDLLPVAPRWQIRAIQILSLFGLVAAVYATLWLLSGLLTGNWSWLNGGCRGV